MLRGHPGLESRPHRLARRGDRLQRTRHRVLVHTCVVVNPHFTAVPCEKNVCVLDGAVASEIILGVVEEAHGESVELILGCHICRRRPPSGEMRWEKFPKIDWDAVVH